VYIGDRGGWGQGGIGGGWGHIKCTIVKRSYRIHRVCNFVVVYYESINRDLKIKSIYECRCYERLQTKTTFVSTGEDLKKKLGKQR